MRTDGDDDDGYDDGNNDDDGVLKDDFCLGKVNSVCL